MLYSLWVQLVQPALISRTVLVVSVYKERCWVSTPNSTVDVLASLSKMPPTYFISMLVLLD